MELIRHLRRRLINHQPSKPSEAPELDYKAVVGGHWDDVGRMQYDFLVKQGLKPHHFLLDVGCGSFRGGRFFIKYLMDGHYFGIEKDSAITDAGIQHVLKPTGLMDKKPQIHNVELLPEPTNFQAILGARFDYIWIHAVFDHVPHDVIRFCFHNLAEVMESSGRLYATIFLNPHGPDFLEPMIRPRYGSLDRAVVTFPDREYWHHTIKLFEDIVAEISGLRLDACIYDYPHPLGLRVLRFIRL